VATDAVCPRSIVGEAVADRYSSAGWIYLKEVLRLIVANYIEHHFVVRILGKTRRRRQLSV